MARQISLQDKKLIRSLREADVLQSIQLGLLDQRNGITLITCSDGDRICDVFDYHVAAQRNCRAHPRPHMIALHGGAPAFAPMSPFNTRDLADETLFDQVALSQEAKPDIRTIAAYAHWPCGMAALKKVDLRDLISLHIQANDRIKDHNKNFIVAQLFHVDYGNGIKRSYFLCTKSWEAWVHAHSH
jgi:hypothetical protein